jgi:hypothetical protein
MPAILLPGIDATGKPVQISVWVAPFVPKFSKRMDGTPVRVKSSTHRVRCSCPGCGAELSAGRLFQHVCPGPISSKELTDEEALRVANVARHPPTLTCDCSACRSARASGSNPHGYVYRGEG